MENQLYFDRKKFHAICSRLGRNATVPELNQAFAAAMSTNNPDDEAYRKLTDTHLCMDFDEEETMTDEGYSILDECDNIFADVIGNNLASPEIVRCLHDDNFFDEYEEYPNFESFGIGLDDPEDFEDDEYLYA